MKRVEILDQNIRSIAQRERGLLAELIEYLREMEAAQGFFQLGFNSLFDYLTRGVGYSEGSAQRRIDAARLSKDVPDLGARIESGAINLNHATTVNKAARQSKRNVSAEEKREILSMIEKQSKSKSEQVVAEFFDLGVITETKKTTQKDKSVRYEITMSAEDDLLLKQAQALISHSVPTNNLADFIRYVSEKIIKQKATPARKKSTAKVAAEKPATATMAAKPVPQRVHREVRSEQPACVDCGTLWFPQTDHRHSRWAGGSNDRENLETRCGPCNRAKYRRESGIKPFGPPKSRVPTTDPVNTT